MQTTKVAVRGKQREEPKFYTWGHGQFSSVYEKLLDSVELLVDKEVEYSSCTGVNGK
jgi:hypothetical protein